MDDIKIARRLEYATLGWNVVEAAGSITIGILAASVALVGFGADALIESISGCVLLWRLRSGDLGRSREERALQLVGISFLVLAAYVLFDAVTSLLAHERPQASMIGVLIASISLIVMPVLARAKRRVARRLQSNALAADSRQTALCAYLSAILLLGLTLNQLFGWWWSDPVAALLMVPIIAREGIEALRGHHCCD
jgi:divalent metal cation (Fe/Co/Zn/Cd) transporter